MSASSEFINLCQVQLMLVQSLGASSSVVYLTEQTVDQEATKLIPVVSYPPDTRDPQTQTAVRYAPALPQLGSRQLPGTETIPPSVAQQMEAGRSHEVDPAISAVEFEVKSPAPSERSPSPASDATWSLPTDAEPQFPLDQTVVPLVHNDWVVGVLVATRHDRPWTEQERSQLDYVAETVAIARVMEQQEQWLKDYRQQEQQLKAQQQETVHNFLHQFRNPLTAIHTFGRLLLKRLTAEDDNHGVAASIVRESDHLRELVEQFRTVVYDAEQENGAAPSALPAADVADGATESIHPTVPSPLLLPSSRLQTVETEPWALLDIVEPLIMSAAAIAQEKDLTLVTAFPETSPLVWADAKALREVVSNVIDNAMKYSPAAANIYIKAGIQQWGLTDTDVNPALEAGELDVDIPLYQGLVIADTGPGIPPADLDRVFERHYRGVQAQTDIPGTGLGLAIAQDLMHQMEGDIQVFSPVTTCPLLENWNQLEANQSGTAFVLWLLDAE
jgi:signal transduction histidine kinase